VPPPRGQRTGKSDEMYAATVRYAVCEYDQTKKNKEIFKVYPEWKAQQKILWAEVRRETGKWKSRWMTRDLLADGRCSRAVLDFLAATDVERRVPAQEDTVSEVSEVELREGGKNRGGRRGGTTTLFLPTPDFMASAGGE